MFNFKRKPLIQHQFSLLFFILIHIFFILVGYNSSKTIPGDFLDIDNTIQNYFINNLIYGFTLMAGFFHLDSQLSFLSLLMPMYWVRP